MVILTDVDETIEELLVPWTTYLNAAYGTNVTKDDIREWDMAKAYPTLTSEQLYEPLKMRELWESVEEIPNAGYYMQKLMSEGDEIILVTSSHYSGVNNKVEYMINRLFPFIGWDNVIMTRKKHLVRGDVMIDDYEQNLLHGKWSLKILVDAPYNRDFDNEKHKIKRAKSWDEIYSFIKELKDGEKTE